MTKIFFILSICAMQPLTAMEEEKAQYEALSPEQLFSKLYSELISYETTNNYTKTCDAVRKLVQLGANINKKFTTSISSGPKKSVTLVEWALNGENDLSVYEILLENGATISPQLSINKSRRSAYITIKHIIRRVFEKHKTSSIEKGITEECKKALEPYQDKRKEYISWYEHDIYSDQSIERFLKLFISSSLDRE